MEEEACTDVLSLVRRCASSMDGVVSQSGGLSLEVGASPLVSPQVGFVRHPLTATFRSPNGAAIIHPIANCFFLKCSCLCKQTRWDG